MCNAFTASEARLDLAKREGKVGPFHWRIIFVSFILKRISRGDLLEKGRQAVSGEIELWWKEEVAQVQEFPQQHCGHHRYPWQFRGYYDLVIKA